MKKILLFAVCFLAVVSCKKHNNTEQPTPMVTISFDQRIVYGNSMVRSTSNEFLDIIEEQTPKVVTVTLVNTDLEQTYTCNSTETITVPLGNYEVSAASTKPSESVSGSGCYYAKPYLKTDKQNIKITMDTNSITLPLYYNCYAVFALAEECEKVSPSIQLHNNKYYIAYFYTDSKIVLTPYENTTEYTTTTFEFSLTYSKDKEYAEFGKYYVLHPTKVDTSTSTFDVQFPTMQEGEI